MHFQNRVELSTEEQARPLILYLTSLNYPIHTFTLAWKEARKTALDTAPRIFG